MTNPKTMSVNLGPGLVTFYHIRARKWSRPSLTTLGISVEDCVNRTCRWQLFIYPFARWCF